MTRLGLEPRTYELQVVSWAPNDGFNAYSPSERAGIATRVHSKRPNAGKRPKAERAAGAERAADGEVLVKADRRAEAHGAVLASTSPVETTSTWPR